MDQLVAFDYVHHKGKDYRPGDGIEFEKDEGDLLELLTEQGKIGKKADWDAAQKPPAETESPAKTTKAKPPT